MTIKEAIEKAVEGGWYPKTYKLQIIRVFEERGHVEVFEDYHFLLDKDFWIALGKSLKWERRMMIQKFTENDDISATVDGGQGWQYQWMRLIDHLASGKSIETYFEELN